LRRFTINEIIQPVRIPAGTIWRGFFLDSRAGIPYRGGNRRDTMKRILIFALLLVWVSAGYGDDIETLRGLREIGVLIEDLNDDAKAAGLTRLTLQMDVALKLRKVGIKVSGFIPYLYIRVNSIAVAYISGEKTGAHVYVVNVRLCETVSLERDPAKIVFSATTWTRDGFGFVPKNVSLSQTVRQAVADNVDEFINDYLAANPIERTK